MALSVGLCICYYFSLLSHDPHALTQMQSLSGILQTLLRGTLFSSSSGMQSIFWMYQIIVKENISILTTPHENFCTHWRCRMNDYHISSPYLISNQFWLISYLYHLFCSLTNNISWEQNLYSVFFLFLFVPNGLWINVL